MKLIIDIPKEVYKKAKETHDVMCDKVWLGIKYGTPLDDVIGKIEKLNPVDYGSIFSYESHNGARDMKRDILDILDNIGKAESEDK